MRFASRHLEQLLCDEWADEEMDIHVRYNMLPRFVNTGDETQQKQPPELRVAKLSLPSHRNDEKSLQSILT